MPQTNTYSFRIYDMIPEISHLLTPGLKGHQMVLIANATMFYIDSRKINRTGYTLTILFASTNLIPWPNFPSCEYLHTIHTFWGRLRHNFSVKQLLGFVFIFIVRFGELRLPTSFSPDSFTDIMKTWNIQGIQQIVANIN